MDETSQRIERERNRERERTEDSFYPSNSFQAIKPSAKSFLIKIDNTKRSVGTYFGLGILIIKFQSYWIGDFNQRQ
jgi:hypothetical protein